MPTVRFDGQGDEAEGTSGTLTGQSSAEKELVRVTSNQTLSEHIGKFVAGEIQNRFKDENLSTVLKGGERMISVSVSWG
jgi:hypothetical protein